MTSVFETILSYAHSALAPMVQDGTLISLERARSDAVSAQDVPAVILRRGEVQSSQLTDRTNRASVPFHVEIWVAQKSGDETTLDQLHCAAHDLLRQSTTLAQVAGDVQLQGTSEPEEISGEVTFTRMTATYVVETLYMASDLSLAR